MVSLILFFILSLFSFIFIFDDANVKTDELLAHKCKDAHFSMSQVQCLCNITELVQWVRYAKYEGGSSGSEFGIPLFSMITDLRPEMFGVVLLR